MTIPRWIVPEGGPIGWVANTSEAIKSLRNPDYYKRQKLTSNDLERLSKFDLSSTAFAQGHFDNCYIVASLKSLMDSPWGQDLLRSNLEVTEEGAIVHFYCEGTRVPIFVRSIFKRGNTPASWGSVIESAYAEFRLEHKGRLPTMGFPGNALEELTGHKPTVSHMHKVRTLRRSINAQMPALASTVRTDPTRFLDEIDWHKQAFNALAPALVPGVGRVELQIRSAHVYQVAALDQKAVALVNPWEYNQDAHGNSIRARGAKHPGTFLLGTKHFRILFGQVATLR